MIIYLQFYLQSSKMEARWRIVVVMFCFFGWFKK